MKNYFTLDNLSPKGKVVLLRMDLNVPMQDGVVTDDTRITRAAETLKEITEKGGKVVLLSHFGRPRGKDPSQSLAPLKPVLERLWGIPIAFVDDCIGDVPKAAIARMKDGDVLLLENTRFYPEEEKNDPAFAAQMASLGNIYVNDAFSSAHRAHVSTEGLARLMPAYAGRLMEAELDALHKALGQPARPLVAIVGGAKVSTKLDLLNNLLGKVDVLVLGGAMANTFFHAQGLPIGKSLCEREMDPQALKILQTAQIKKCKIVLPTDGIVATELRAGTKTQTILVDSIPSDEMMLDIGPQTASRITAELQNAKTVIWNGPMGAFETPPFDQGTLAVAKAIADLTVAGKIVSIAGGGDTVSALSHAYLMDKMTYVSTAGGAFLEWMEGKDLPGVKALQMARQKPAAAV